MAERPAQLIEDAASILEEEVVASGIDTARDIQARLFGNERGQGETEAVIPRLRRDAHEIVDLAADLLNEARSMFGGSPSSPVEIREDTAAAGARGRRVPTLIAAGSASASDPATVTMTVENSSAEATDSFELVAPTLVSPAGEEIAAKQISFDPARATVPPRESEKIIIAVAIPDGTPAGSYSGLLQATGLGSVQAVLVVEVT